MRTSVLVVLSPQEPLRESALAAQSGKPIGLDVAGIRVPAAIALDPSFPAIPLGTGAMDATARSMAPTTSLSFVVRGTIEAEHIPETTPEGARLFSDPVIEPFPICPGDPPSGTTLNVQASLDVARLHANGLDGRTVAVAVMDSGINVAHLRTKGLAPNLDAAVTWAPSGVSTLPGASAVGHGTMCAYDVLAVAPQATLFDYPILRSSTIGGSAISGTLGDALQAYSHLMAFWAVVFGPTRPKYNALVINNSWGMYQLAWDFPAGHPGRYADNPNHPFNLIVGVMTRLGVDVLFAAGNCGTPCPSSKCGGHTSPAITGANAHADVLTVAGCDVADTRVGYSSQGPAIARMGANKPDLTAYTHFLGSEAIGTGNADSGTSTACPIAAGCVAALRSSIAPTVVTPAALFQDLRLTARQVVGVGWNADYGHGIIDVVAAARGRGLVP